MKNNSSTIEAIVLHLFPAFLSLLLLHMTLQDLTQSYDSSTPQCVSTTFQKPGLLPSRRKWQLVEVFPLLLYGPLSAFVRVELLSLPSWFYRLARACHLSTRVKMKSVPSQSVTLLSPKILKTSWKLLTPSSRCLVTCWRFSLPNLSLFQCLPHLFRQHCCFQHALFLDEFSRWCTGKLTHYSVDQFFILFGQLK